MPFEVPESWVWCRLGEVGELKRGKSKHRPRNDKKLFENGIYPFIQTGDVSNAKYNKDLITTTNNFYSEFGLKQSKMQSKGTLCITIAANIAECGFLDFDACVPDSIVCFNSINKSIEKFVYYYIKSAKDELERFAPATAQKNINLGILNNFLIPIPPLQEQSRIVSEVEEYFTLINQIEENKLSLSQFIKQTKSKILDLAIRGKLVSQNPNDEPASVLLERIKNEQKTKKIRADISHYTDNEFELPNNWEVTSMQNVCFLYDGEKTNGKELPYLDVRYLRGKSVAKILSSGKFVSKNSTMILVDGENSGELFSVMQDGYQGSTFKILNISNFVDKDFIFKILQKEQSTFRESKVGSAIPHLDKKLFRELPVFLPPLAEQKRIVQKIESIFQILDSIQNNL